MWYLENSDPQKKTVGIGMTRECAEALVDGNGIRMELPATETSPALTLLIFSAENEDELVSVVGPLIGDKTEVMVNGRIIGH